MGGDLYAGPAARQGPVMKAKPWTFDGSVAGHRWLPDGEPRGRLLLAHGFAEHAGRYVERHAGLVPALVARGWAVHAWDYRGHGASPGARGVVDVAREVARHRAARAAMASAEAGPVFCFGHSLGGLVTAASVAADPGGVAGVVLSAPALLIEAPGWLKLVGRAVARVAPGAGIRPALDPAGISRLPGEVAAYRDDARNHHGKLPAITGASALAVSEAAWARYPDWQVPVLALHGTADPFTDPRGSERFVAAVGAADKRLVMVEGGRHELLNDIGREEALALVLGWLESRLVPPRNGEVAGGEGA